jgi:hypothetical protein
LDFLVLRIESERETRDANVISFYATNKQKKKLLLSPLQQTPLGTLLRPLAKTACDHLCSPSSSRKEGGSTSIVGVVFGTYLHEQHRHTHLKKAHVKLVDSMGGNGRIEWPCMHAETQHLE